MEGREGSPIAVAEKKSSLPVVLKVPRRAGVLMPSSKIGPDQKFPSAEEENYFSDESKPATSIIRPLREVIIRENGINVDFTKSLQTEMDYLASTRDLEFDTPRTAVLQKIVDTMLDGRDIGVKVYIMKKGLDQNAFACADGSVFVSQSLINGVDNLDELAGVLGHELGHLIHGTFQKKILSHDDFGVGWIHESSSDASAPFLLEKAGLNSTAFASAIIKISGATRGVEHQTGLSRGSQSIGMHFGVDFATSGVELTVLPPKLATAEVPKTNRELIVEAIKSQNVEAVAKLVKRLHPRDLAEAYEITSKQEYSYRQSESLLPQDEIDDIFRNHLIEKLVGAGFELDDIGRFFLFSNHSSSNSNFDFIKKPEDTLRLFEGIEDFANSNKLGQMSEVIFGDYKIFPNDNLANNFLSKLEGAMYDPSYSNESRKIPIDKQSLFAILKKANSLPKESLYWMDLFPSPQAEIARVLESYLIVVCAKNREPDMDKARQIIEEFNGFGIEFTKKDITGRYGENEINSLMQEILVREIEQPTYFEQIDKAFANLDVHTRLNLENLIDGLRKGFDDQSVIDENRQEYLEYIFDKIDSTRADTYLERGRDKDQWNGNPETLEAIQKYKLKEAFVLGIFEKDSQQFYETLTGLMQDSQIDLSQLDWYESVNLAHNLLNQGSRGAVLHQTPGRGPNAFSFYEGTTQIEDFNRYLDLPFLKAVDQKNPSVKFNSLGQLYEYESEVLLPRIFGRGSAYGDNLYSLFVYKDIRANLADLVQPDLSESEFGNLFNLVSLSFPQSPRRDTYLRELNRRYLKSPEASLPQKVEYLKNSFDRVGIEGMVMVADQINNLADYRFFQKEMYGRILQYREGSGLVLSFAAADVLTSEFTKNFEDLLKTAQTDSQAKRETSTIFAKEWKRRVMRAYEVKEGKFLINEAGREAFATVADYFARLQAFSPVRRFAVVHKALVDKDGALTSAQNREKLGKILVDSLNPKSSFIRSAVKLGAEVAPAEFFGFPASQMLAPMLFRSFNIGSIDLDKIDFRSAGISKDEFRKIIALPTRDVVVFGANFKKKEGSAASLVRESEAQFTLTNRVLERLLVETEPLSNEEKKSKIDPATEAVISAVEASGALGVRSLQLARQFNRFSPEVDERLAQSFDSRPGLNKLLFWENLLKLGETNSEIRDFVENRLITLDEFLGGGSLYTTFAATVRGEDGQPKNVVYKMLNPNQGLFVGTDKRPAVAYETTMKVLETIEETGSPKDKNYARMGKIFMDLSQQWCFRDINDPSFEVDDDLFRNTVDGFNQSKGASILYQPHRVFNGMKLKSEEQAEGQTLNKVLADPEVSEERKKQVVGIVIDFFKFQLQTPAGKTEAGEDYYLVHSDPHIGNYVVDFDEEGGPKIGVIDRNMYLKLSRKEAISFRKLLGGGYGQFVPAFIDTVVERNKYNGETAKLSKNRVMAGLASEYVKQRGKSAMHLTREVDNMALLRKLLGQFAAAKLDIPLEHRLMVRNVEAFRQLKQRYS